MPNGNDSDRADCYGMIDDGIDGLRAMEGKTLVHVVRHSNAIETGVGLTFTNADGTVESVIIAAQSAPECVVHAMMPGADLRPTASAEGDGIG